MLYLESSHQRAKSASSKLSKSPKVLAEFVPETGRLHVMAIEDAHNAQANHHEELTVERIASTSVRWPRPPRSTAARRRRRTR